MNNDESLIIINMCEEVISKKKDSLSDHIEVMLKNVWWNGFEEGYKEAVKKMMLKVGGK